MPDTKIFLLPLMLGQYDAWIPALRPAQEVFLQTVSKLLANFGVLTNPGICTTRNGVEAAISQAEAEQSDVIIVVLVSYAPSLIAAPALAGTKLPVLILNTTPRAEMGADIETKDYLENHAIHGVQDLASVLHRAGKPYNVVSGPITDSDFAAKTADFISAAQAATQWKKLRVGRVGAGFPDMGDFAIDATTLQLSGPSRIDIAPAEYQQAWDNAKQASITALMAQYQAEYDVSQVGAECLSLTAHAEIALRDLVLKYCLDAVAFSFLIFEHLRNSTMPFVGASRLMAEGVGYAGEADALGASAVAILQKLTGAAGFTEMFCPDWTRNLVLMSHMGEANTKFAASRPKMIEKPFLLGGNIKPGVLLFESEPGPVTLASLNLEADGKLRWVAAEGEIVKTSLYPALDAPHYLFRPAKSLPDFLTEYSDAAGSHHLALCKGKVMHRIELLSKLMGAKFQPL